MNLQYGNHKGASFRVTRSNTNQTVSEAGVT